MVTHTLIVTPAAEGDIAEITNWYDDIDQRLASSFRAALQDTFRQIAEYPDAYAPLAHGLHRALLYRFSYGVHYRKLGQVIQVVAVLHTSRHPRIWQARSH